MINNMHAKEQSSSCLVQLYKLGSKLNNKKIKPNAKDDREFDSDFK